MNNNVSIILCFYNAENKLDKTLNAIKQLSIPTDTLVELILVNNNSSDQSQDIIEHVLGSFDKFPVRIVEEKTPGLAFARKKGISVSSYELLLFCDDDNWLAPNYLEISLDTLKNDPKIAVLGGMGKPTSDIAIPEWFNDVQNYYAVGPQMKQSGEVKGKRNVVYGAGMWVRKIAFEKIVSQGFDFFTVGRTESKLSSGEDSELCLALRIAGNKIWYLENLNFEHYIEPNRLSNEYLKSLKAGMVSSRFVIRFYLDYLNGYTPSVTKYFWIKESLFNLKDFFINLLQFNTSEMNRNIEFGKYLITENKSYNNNVKYVVELCKRISASASS